LAGTRVTPVTTRSTPNGLPVGGGFKTQGAVVAVAVAVGEGVGEGVGVGLSTDALNTAGRNTHGAPPPTTVVVSVAESVIPGSLTAVAVIVVTSTVPITAEAGIFTVAVITRLLCPNI
jgi:hypothetical protein